jgi:hypothetical protein
MLYILPVLAPREVCSRSILSETERDWVKALLTLNTSVEVRIGGVFWRVVCGVLFVLLLLVDNPVKTNTD